MDQENNQNTNQEPTTQPTDNGEQGGGKLFTQEEVNNIIRDRLARERAKSIPQEPTEDEKRKLELDARESKLLCREYLQQSGLPPQLADVLDTSDQEEFRKKANIVSGLLREAGKQNYIPAPLAECEHLIDFSPAGFKNTKHVPRQYGPYGED